MFPPLFTIQKFGCTCNPWVSFLWIQQRVYVTLKPLQCLLSYSVNELYVLVGRLKYFCFDIILFMCLRLLHKKGFVFLLLQLSAYVSITWIIIFFLTPLRDRVYITSGMCLCFLPQFRDCVCITSVICLRLLPQDRERVSITPRRC